MAASVIEVKRENGKWQVVAGLEICAAASTPTTPMEITGPAAGHRAHADRRPIPTGRRVLGMFNNCAGGMTPWGTWLTCEENIHHYFTGKLPDGHPEARNHRRYGVPTRLLRLGQVPRSLQCRQGAERAEPLRLGGRDRSVRSDVDAEEAHRARPRQARRRRRHRQQGRPLRGLIGRRRALRLRLSLRHHRARRSAPIRGPIATSSTTASLSVARYNADGTLDWLPLVHGQGPLTAENGFASQADVLIEKRRAADLLKRDQDGPSGGRRGQPGRRRRSM